MYDVAVVGGGASGLVAASELSAAGKRVALIEKNDRVGKKLLTTGNGRCNLANQDFSMEHYHGSALSLAQKVFQKIGPDEIRDYWSSMGIDMVTLERGKMFPRSLQASSVLNALRRRLEASNTDTLCRSEVTEIRPCQGGYLLKIRVEEEKEVQKPVKGKSSGKGGNKDTSTISKVKVYSEKKIKAEKVILCAGGKASPSLGANGEGARLAKGLDMAIEPLRPGICRLLSDSPYCKRLMGVRMEVPCQLLVDGKCVKETKEEVLVREDGLSGPAILDLSRTAGDALALSRFVQVSMDLAEDMPEGILFRYLQERFMKLSEWTMEDAMEGWMPKKLIVPVLNDAGVDRTQSASSLSKRQISDLVQTIKHFTMNIRSLDGFAEAQVTIGGVRGDSLSEDLSAKRAAGVYLCGEVIDLDGDCGGYNLMWAAASALYVCGEIMA